MNIYVTYLIIATVLAAVGVLLVLAYVVFMKKYYHLHEEYLASLKK